MGSRFTAFIIVADLAVDGAGYLVAELPLGEACEFAMSLDDRTDAPPCPTSVPMPAEVWDKVKGRNLRAVVTGATNIVLAVQVADHHMAPRPTTKDKLGPAAGQLRALAAMVWQLCDDNADERVRLILTRDS